jgi:hypothetical protein
MTIGPEIAGVAGKSPGQNQDGTSGASANLCFGRLPRLSAQSGGQRPGAGRSCWTTTSGRSMLLMTCGTMYLRELV